jgi:hypothetical protein
MGLIIRAHPQQISPPHLFAYLFQRCGYFESTPEFIAASAPRCREAALALHIVESFVD